MKKAIYLLLAAALLASAFGCTPYHARGATTGAAVGGISGAVLDHKNPWRGGVIGGALGAIMGATLADVSYQASQEAAMRNQPVEYRTDNGRGIYRAEPMGYNERTRCRKVKERVWEDGRLVKDQVREICEGERYERRY